MQNLFMPSETVACIEQKYIGRTYKINGKAYSEPFTKEKIRSLFDVYIESINQVFGGRAIVMQRTRAIKGGSVVPVTSYEYVYNNRQSISTYIEEGYYGLTVNGYRIRDILDSGYHYFTDSLNIGGQIIDEVSGILGIDRDAVKEVLVDFFCNNSFETFDAFLEKIMVSGKTDVYKFDVCASVTCSFGEPLPAIGSSTEIQVMSRHAQDNGLAVDECDLDGWKGVQKGEAKGRTKDNVIVFFDQAFDYLTKFDTPLPCDADKNTCDCKNEDPCCEECKDHEDFGEDKDDFDGGDGLDEIRKDIDRENSNDRVAKKDVENIQPKRSDEEADISSASDGNKYTYSITWTDKDGKQQSKTFYGEAAKKMMSKGNCMDEKLEDECDNKPTLKDVFNLIDKRLAKLEGDMRDLQQPERPERPVRVRLDRDPFDLFGGFRDLFGGF